MAARPGHGSPGPRPGRRGRFPDRPTGDPDEQAAGELATELGGLPLALAQAAAYIQATGENLAGYLAICSGSVARTCSAAASPPGTARPSRRPGRWRSPGWSRTHRLRPGCCGCWPASHRSRSRCTCFSHRDPPGALDADAAGLGPLLGDSLAVGDAVAALRRYSLVTPAGDGLVSVHRLVQAVTLDRMPDDLAAEWRQAAATLIEAAIPADTGPPESWPAYAVLLPHAQAAIAVDGDGMERIAKYLGHSGNYAAARDLPANRRLHELTPGPRASGHTDRSRRPRMLDREAGNHAAARDMLAALLPVRERVLGSEHQDTLTARTNLASWTGEAGDAAAARDMYAALLPVRERVCGPEHRTPWPPVATSPTGPGRRVTRPRPATWTPRCCPSASGSPAPTTRTP